MENEKGWNRIHPEILKNWNNQEEYEDPLEFLRKVYLIESPPAWSIAELANEKIKGKASDR